MQKMFPASRQGCCGIPARAEQQGDLLRQEFITKTAGLRPCTHLSALINTLEAQGMQIEPAAPQPELHPFAISIARQPAAHAGGWGGKDGAGGGEERLCLLRMPGSVDANAVQVVRTAGPPPSAASGARADLQPPPRAAPRRRPQAH